MTDNDNKKPLKIAIYTICKNEVNQVERWAASNSEADVRLICDTGSTDGTQEALRKHGVMVFDIVVNPWRFDVARNSSLNLLPQDVDICIWQDLDEALLPGWRQELESKWEEDATVGNHRYRFNGGEWQWHYKIHARHDCFWRYPVHEKLTWATGKKYKEVWLPNFFLDEQQEVKGSRTSYLDLLELKLQEGDTDWKTYAFLAGEYQNIGRYDLELEKRMKSYDLCNDGGIVRSYIARLVAAVYARLDQQNMADLWFQKGITDSPERETYYHWAMMYHDRRDWENCYIAMKKCISINDRRDGYTLDPMAWGVNAYDVAALAAYNIGFFQQAVDYGKKALEFYPNDGRLQTNLRFYEEKING